MDVYQQCETNKLQQKVDAHQHVVGLCRCLLLCVTLSGIRSLFLCPCFVFDQIVGTIHC